MLNIAKLTEKEERSCLPFWITSQGTFACKKDISKFVDKINGSTRCPKREMIFIGPESDHCLPLSLTH